MNSRTDTFLVTDIGTCLLLKLCGFVEEYRAEIREISENHLSLRLCGSWVQRLWSVSPLHYPLDLEILFVPSEMETDSRPQSRVEIVVRDARFLTNTDRFEAATRRVLWQLRSHLLAIS